MKQTFNCPGFYLALTATVIAAAVVMLGAYTRLVDAGLGCPDWPTCYGHLWAPQTDTEITIANQTFPEMPVNLDKTWPEMVHRYLASSLGLLIIALNVTAFRYRHLPEQPQKLPLFLLAFVILQGAFGAWTVTLKLWPQVVTAHLLGGFTTFTLLAILTIRLRRVSLPTPDIPALPILRRLAVLALIAVSAQVLLGGWTTSNYSARVCPDFPKCQTQWWPETDFKKAFDFAHPVGPNYQGGQLAISARTAIHLSHRIGAVLVTFFVLALAVRLMNVGLWRSSTTLLTLLCLQIALGISNIEFGLPLVVAVLHNLGGALLLMMTALINVLLYQKEVTAYV